jgi:hypothetical protein
MGNSRPFDRAQHDSFQRFLGLLGSPDSNAAKSQVIAAITSEQPPFTPEAAASRNARVGIRVALRQMKALGHPSRSLPAWLEVFDRIESDADEDEAAKQHDHEACVLSNVRMSGLRLSAKCSARSEHYRF